MFQIKDFPTSFTDIFLKSWITYKKTFFYFLPLLLVANIIFAIGYFQFEDENIFSIAYLSSTKFILAKIIDAFACFLLPFFLYGKLTNPFAITKTFLKKYLSPLLLTVLPLCILLRYILTGNILFTVINLLVSIYSLFAFCFLIVEKKKIFTIFKRSFLLIRAHWKKTFLFFMSALLLTSIFRFLLEFLFFFSDIQGILSQISGGEFPIKELLSLVFTPKFYLLHSAIHLIYQPFLSLFLAILFYSLASTFCKKTIEDFFSDFTHNTNGRGKAKN
jgi:hypothetical protein